VAIQPYGRRSIKSPNKAPVHKPSLWAGFASIFILLAIIGLRVTGDRLYSFDSSSVQSLGEGEETVIVCLAGGRLRVEAALNLFAAGVGNRLVIIGAGPKSTPMTLLRIHAPDLLAKLGEEKVRAIEVESESKNTIENAFAVGRLAQKNPQWKRIVLVTSSYHMRRAIVTLESQLVDTIELFPFSPQGEIVGRNNWWHSWVGIEITLLEAFKYHLARILMPRLEYFS
jgi:uncharacterized SAM-binding protein YcdF (DUF218 family)